MIKFINLHTHTNPGSIGDAIGFPKDYIDYQLLIGCEGGSLSDHGSLSAFPYAYLYSQELKKKGIPWKQIYGVECYFIDSISDWKIEYDRSKDKGKEQDEEERSIENEEDKLTVKNPLNKRYHLLLLAQNEVGLRNIFRLISRSNQGDNYYRYPRIDFKMLGELNEGIICSSACLGGRVNACYFANKDKPRDLIINDMVDVVNQFKDIFQDRYYLEMQWNGLADQHVINQLLIEVASKTNTKLISTIDAHYPKPELWQSRELYKRLAWLGKGGEQKPLPKTIDEVHYELCPKNGDQMWAAYKKYSVECNAVYDDQVVLDSLENAYHIGMNLIDDYVIDTSINLPDFVVPEGSTDNQQLRKLCEKGLVDKNLNNKTYIDRLNYELSVIEKRQFAKYFLITKEMVDEAWKSYFVGVSRGSAGSSLVSFLLNITQLDPVRWNLPFERFLDPDGKGWPDIDLDYNDTQAVRSLIAKEWKEKYNVDVVQIANFGKFKIKSLLKDISKFYDIEFEEVNAVTRNIDDEALSSAKNKHGDDFSELSYEDCMDFSPSFKNFIEKYPEVKKHMVLLHGQIRSLGRHAAGTVFLNDIESRMPLIRSKGEPVTPWIEGIAGRYLEPLGILKFDLLGLETLNTIMACIERIIMRRDKKKVVSFDEIKEFYMDNLHPDKLNFDDQKVYKNVFHNGKFVSIFQFSQKEVQEFAKKVKPTNIYDLSAITAIYRPGPLAAQIDQKFVYYRDNPWDIKYMHLSMESILARNSGLVIYQEDIASLAVLLGKNINMAEGNKLRKLLIKKGIGEVGSEKEKIHRKFIDGCLEKKISIHDAENLWTEFEGHAKYSFNKGHSLAYCITSYVCAYLLTYYESEFVCAYLEKDAEDAKKKEYAISLVKSLGYEIKEVDINKSYGQWMIDPENDKVLIQPFTTVKGLGSVALEQIMNNQPFNTLEDLFFNDNIKYAKLNKKCLGALALSGALDGLWKGRFNHLRHFWASMIVDRPKTIKAMVKNIELMKNEPDFTLSEKISLKTDIIGIYPLEEVLSEQLKNKLYSRDIQPIGSYNVDSKFHWFVLRDKKEMQTSKGKPYYILSAIDDSFKLFNIKIWNPETFGFELNCVYFGKVNYDPKWGYSISNPMINLRKIS